MQLVISAFGVGLKRKDERFLIRAAPDS